MSLFRTLSFASRSHTSDIIQPCASGGNRVEALEHDGEEEEEEKNGLNISYYSLMMDNQSRQNDRNPRSEG